MLLDKPLVRFAAPRLVGDQPGAGELITAVDAAGKHLLVGFSGGLVLETHMKMTGSWHLYRAGERWLKGQHLMRALIDVGDWLAVCFAAPVVRTHRGDATQSTSVAHLGPDLCTPDADMDAAVARFADVPEPGTSLADALLDQRIACGVGNVYKSEALWACRLSPFATVGSLDGDQRRELLRTAQRQLLSNLTTTTRTTVPGGLAVYGRARQPCRSCGTPIEVCEYGIHPRLTYWCPVCQPAPVLHRHP